MIGIEDRLAIQDLMARYAWALDTGDVEGFVSCFTADAVVLEEVFEDPDRWEGQEGIRHLAEHYRQSAGFPGRQHHISQLLIEGAAPECTARSYAFVTECHGEPPYTLRFTGYYEDRVRREADGWRFVSRRIRLWDGPVLQRFPGHGTWKPRKRPPELVVKRR